MSYLETGAPCSAGYRYYYTGDLTLYVCACAPVRGAALLLLEPKWSLSISLTLLQHFLQ